MLLQMSVSFTVGLQVLWAPLLPSPLLYNSANRQLLMLAESQTTIYDSRSATLRSNERQRHSRLGLRHRLCVWIGAGNSAWSSRRKAA